MKKLSLLFMILLLFTANITLASPVGKIIYTEGRVDVLKPGQTVATPVSKGDSVEVGDIYRAKSNSKAEIAFVNKNVLRIAQNTRTEIKEYSIEGDRSSGVIKLYRGKVQAIAGEEFVKRVSAFAEGNKLEVHTPNAVAGVRGTVFAVSYEGGITWIFCLEGKVYAFNWANPSVIILIPANFISNVGGENPPTQPMGLGKGYFETYIMPWVTKNLEKITEIWQLGTGGGAGTDTTPPVLTLTSSSATPGWSGDLSSLSFTISSDETAALFYGFDGSEWTSTLGTVSLADIAEGDHTFKYFGIDEAGNVTPVTYLDFDLTRYTYTGVAHNNGSFGMSADVSGNVAAICNQEWGGWNLSLYFGYYESTPSGQFQVVAGGTNSAITGDGYWLSLINMSASGDEVSGTLSGSLNLTHLTQYTLGTGTGTLTGAYLSSGGSGTWEASAQGQYASEDLTFVSDFYADLYYYDGSLPNYEGTLEGLMGGTSSLWTATQTEQALFTAIGTFYYDSNPTQIWGTEVYSNNYQYDTKTTYDGGTYYGYIGGTKDPDNNLDGRFRAIYIDPSNQAGYLMGSLTGKYYSDIDMFEMDGSAYPVQIFDSISGINPGNLYTSLLYNTFGVSGSGTFPSGSIGIDSGQMNETFTPNRELAIWKNVIYGTYSGTTSNTWTLSTTSNIDGSYYSGTETTGTLWSTGSDYKLAGSTVGYGADISTAKTWISVGETLGTYNPGYSSFQAVQMGINLETTQFLTMAGKIGSTPNIAALQAMNIPCVEVGRATLTGSGNGFSSLAMSDVIFFASNALAKPTIWATGSVTGNYSTPPSLGSPIGLSGSGLNANFTFQGWNPGGAPGNWVAGVNGTGGFNGSTTFSGAAAGTGAGSGSGSISGTGAGVAK